MNDERKLALTLCFDGAPYHGWQVQKGAPTVQKTVQNALEVIAGHPLPVTGCSRTDAGVHANMYVCHTDDFGMAPEVAVRALNAHLPDSIAVTDARYVPYDFHARYSCVGKEYIYKIWNAPYRDPFSIGRTYFFPRPVDETSIAFVCDELCGRHDFRAFMAQGSKITEDTVRTVEYCTLRRDGHLLTLSVKADGFLYNMVRIIVGTCLDAASGRYQPGDVAAAIASHSRKNAGFTAPAEGLYLNRVFY